ncbi:hypothetical protein Tco_0793716 [Tanacetum coccineum]
MDLFILTYFYLKPTYPSTPLAISYPTAPYPNAYSSTVHQDTCSQLQSIPQIEYTVSTVNQQTHLAKFSQIDSGLTVLVFNQGDYSIDAINKIMSFLSTVVTYRFPSTNNQLRNSSNPRQQATIHDGWVTVQPLQGRSNSYVVAQGNGKILNEEELELLANPGIAEGPVTQSVIIHNAAYQVDDLDAYDSECNDFSTAKAVLMANFSSYGSIIKNDLRKFKGKYIVDNVTQVSNATTVAPGMYKLDPVTLAPKDKNNRKTHIYYLKHTMEQAAILREIVEQAYSLNPLDSASYSACKRPKVTKTNGSNSKPKIAKSVISNKTKPDTYRGSNTSVASSSSSSVDLRLSKLFCGIWTPDAQST